ITVPAHSESGAPFPESDAALGGNRMARDIAHGENFITRKGYLRLFAATLTFAIVTAPMFNPVTSAELVTDSFVRTGKSESLIAPLNIFGGITTSTQWSGFIEFDVSGVGVRDPNTGNGVDAFYEFNPLAPGQPVSPTHDWGLRLSFTGCAA